MKYQGCCRRSWGLRQLFIELCGPLLLLVRVKVFRFLSELRFVALSYRVHSDREGSKSGCYNPLDSNGDGVRGVSGRPK